MRIQHNITAMNSYRNFAANNGNLSKNLEKLSSGYKINRAGDDAAGLAISEKMRAQITGLEGANKNAKDGISLIQTAEGALTEVHDMLNRMTTLAEQSANGTYADDVDREQLQKEVEALKSEIDRIADSTNFNGIKLLDGSLSGGSNIKGNVTLADTTATATVAKTNALTDQAGLKDGDKITYRVKWTENGVDKSEELNFTVSYDENAGAGGTSKLVASDGTRYDMTTTVSAEDDKLQDAIMAEFKKNDALTAAFKIEKEGNANDGQFKLTSKTLGSKGASMINVDATLTYGAKTTTPSNVDKTVQIGGSQISSNTPGKDVMQKLDFANVKVLDTSKTNYDGRTLSEIIDANTFEIDGNKFVLYAADNASKIDEFKAAAGSDVNFIQLDGANKAATNSDYVTGTAATNQTDAKTIAAELSRVTGREFIAAQVDSGTGEVDNAGNWSVLLKGDKLSRTGKSLTLQIGDTADEFNKMSVAVKDMHAKSLGVGEVDISSQTGAAEALNKIKDAINFVSDQRGSLGALSNRLDHTINNLGVMRENIQNAESTIRDTDVAEEMMAYTKNSILNQSAQAMLAQANQLPQGVLQLLG